MWFYSCRAFDESNRWSVYSHGIMETASLYYFAVSTFTKLGNDFKSTCFTYTYFWICKFNIMHIGSGLMPVEKDNECLSMSSSSLCWNGLLRASVATGDLGKPENCLCPIYSSVDAVLLFVFVQGIPCTCTCCIFNSWHNNVYG